MKLFRELYQYREFLKTNIQKEIRGKYKGSFLGVLWSFVNPLLQVAVYAIVFPYLLKLKGGDNYLLYLIVGIIPWTFFTTTLTQGMGTIKYNGGVIKKVYFPREVLPISVVLSGLVNFAISCIIIAAFVIGSGVGLSWHLVFLPVIALIQSILSLGIVFALSAINVYIQDTEYIINFVINMLFYGTPILYQVTQFSDAPQILLKLINLNPMTHVLNMYREIFIYHEVPNMTIMVMLFGLAIVALLIGYAIFKKLEKGFAEEL